MWDTNLKLLLSSIVVQFYVVSPSFNVANIFKMLSGMHYSPKLLGIKHNFPSYSIEKGGGIIAVYAQLVHEIKGNNNSTVRKEILRKWKNAKKSKDFSGKVQIIYLSAFV